MWSAEEEDWALVIEVSGFSPRSGIPEVQVYAFGSRLLPETPSSYQDSSFFYPIAEGEWTDEETEELVAEDATQVELRGVQVPIPSIDALEAEGIELEESPRIQTFELCRWLAAKHRDAMLATPEERRGQVPPELAEILVLDAWHHPNVVDESERASGSATFQQLARVLVSGDVKEYRPASDANTHWSNWPDGGSL